MDGGVMLMTIDPGKNACGWAIFQEDTLIACGYDLSAQYCAKSYGVDKIVVELPQIYRQRQQKGDPNDLVSVAFAAGRFVQEALHGATTIQVVRPHDWKGSRPKHIDNKVTFNALSNAERELVPMLPDTKLHNVIDAIGIGLWALGRR
jgi:hypothetical protein